MNTATSSTDENGSEDILGNMYSISANIAANVLNNSGELINTSYRLHTSHCSTISNESDISLLSLSLDKEMENANPIDIDELPAFEIRLISPLGRIPSPIDSEDMATPTRPLPFPRDRLNLSPCRNHPDYVALHDINAQISPPSDHGDNEEDESSPLSRTSSLETIFEGVFLNTPPRQRLNMQNHRHSRSRTSLLEKVALNRLNTGKENQSPSFKHETPSPRQNALDFSCITHSDNDTDHGFS